MDFILFISFFIYQRLFELWFARRNEKWLRANGAIEYGQKHYPFIVLLHTAFIASMIIEYFFSSRGGIDPSFAALWFLLIAAKIWVITSLGHYWNTKIFRIPGVTPIRRGPYRFLRHPNYVIVVCEFIVVPLVFHLFYTALIFSILNAIMLTVRIKEEEKVWNDVNF